MTSVVIARQNDKIAAFREATAQRLCSNVVDIICALAADSSITIRMQLEPLTVDHSLAVSSEGMGNISVGLYKSFDIMYGKLPRRLVCKFLPARGSMIYTTGHGFSIHIVRLEGAGMVRVFARGEDTGELSCFQGEVRYHASPLRAEVRDGFYVILDRIMIH